RHAKFASRAALIRRRRVLDVRLAVILSSALIAVAGCGKGGLKDLSLGSQSYPNYPDCKQALYKGRPIPSVFLKKLIKSEGDRLEGIACHGSNIVIDVKTGAWKDGRL